MQTTLQLKRPLPPKPRIVTPVINRHARASTAAPPTKLLCLDIETVPDSELLPADWDRQKFPKPAWHRIVSISFAVARIEKDPEGLETYIVESCRSGGEPTWDEERLLRGFWTFFAAGNYRIVSWNGRAFDLPVLLTRAFIYGIPTGAFHLRGDRWTGYTKRYSSEFHSDLMDLMSQHGAAPRLGLDEMATAMGLPGKQGEHGSNVEVMMAEGRVDRVRAYCERDVLNTLALYIRWCASTGRSSLDGHDAAMRRLVEYLHEESPEKPHFAAFLKAWIASTRPAPGLLGGNGSSDSAEA